MFFLLVYTNLF